MFGARTLPGLPVYGPGALSFPKADAFREGFVVEFETALGNTWVGNFAKYDSGESSISSIHTDLGPKATVVVAAGAAYLVDVDGRCLVREIGFDVHYVSFVAEIDAFVVSNGLWFEAFNAHEVLWRSRRFSWDGIRNVSRNGVTIKGEAVEAPTDIWLSFRLDVLSGNVEGGSYSGPD